MSIEAWNTFLFEKFLRFRWVVTEGLAIHGDVTIDRLALRGGERVIDLGCGFGETTLQLARAIGPDGRVHGVDGAARSVEVGRGDAGEAALGNATFAAADVQSGDLGGPWDVAFSRFGTMFFDNPVAAMQNVRRSLAEGGRLGMAVWRKRDENGWLHEAEKVARGIVPSREEPDQITCGPGPFSMASADLVTTVLMSAGFQQVALERFDAPICVGRDLEEALAFSTAIGPAGELIRLAGDEGERLKPRVLEALALLFSGMRGPDGRIYASSSSWIVTARA